MASSYSKKYGFKGFNISDDEIEDTINSINSLIERPENAAVWGDEWNHVLQHTLGVIDGSEEARSIRESAGDERWVAVDLQALAPQYSSDIQVVAGQIQRNNPYYFAIAYLNEPDSYASFMSIEEITQDEYFDYMAENKVFTKT